MDVKKELTYVYGWNHYTMRFIGIWPDERKWNQASSYLVLTPILMMLCFVCIPQTLNIPIIWKDLYLVVENLSVANITITIALLKTIAFWFNGKPLKSLLRCMSRDWASDVKPSEREIMMGIARTTRTTIIRSTLMVNAVVGFYCFLRYYSVNYSENKLLFRGYFPYDQTTSRNILMTAFGQLIATLYAAASYTAVDTFVAMLVLHVCGQLSILKQDILSLRENGEEKMQIALGRIIRKHVYLNAFVETIEKCFNMMLLLQMLGCTVQLCFQVFQAIMSLGGEEKWIAIFQILFLALYVVYVTLQLYLYCHVGEKLTVESADIANAAYNSEWYNLSAKNAKLLVIVICRGQLPLQITARRFFSLTMVIYAEILKRSMGYISVLYAMKNK